MVVYETPSSRMYFPYMTLESGLFIIEKKIRHEAVCDTKIFLFKHCRLSFEIYFLNLFLTQGSRDLALAVVDEEDNGTLLLHNITSDDIYRKQEGELACYAFLIAISFFFLTHRFCSFYLVETIISWRDPEKALELALSFQEAEGCSYIW